MPDDKSKECDAINTMLKTVRKIKSDMIRVIADTPGDLNSTASRLHTELNTFLPTLLKQERALEKALKRLERKRQ
jgi:hypothetical protein